MNAKTTKSEAKPPRMEYTSEATVSGGAILPTLAFRVWGDARAVPLAAVTKAVGVVPVVGILSLARLALLKCSRSC